MGSLDYRSTIMCRLSENVLFIGVVLWKWSSGVFMWPPVAFPLQSSHPLSPLRRAAAAAAATSYIYTSVT